MDFSSIILEDYNTDFTIEKGRQFGDPFLLWCHLVSKGFIYNIDKQNNFMNISVDHLNQIINKKEDLKVNQTFNNGWNCTKKNYGPFLGFFWIQLLIGMGVGLISGIFTGNINPVESFALYLGLSYLIQIFTSAFTTSIASGIYIFGNKYKSFGKADFSDFFQAIKHYPQFLVYTLLTIVITLIVFSPIIFLYGDVFMGLYELKDDPLAIQQNIMAIMNELSSGLFLMIPLVIVLMIVFMFIIFAPAIMAVYKMNAMDSIKLSISKVKQNFGSLFLLFLAFVGIGFGAIILMLIPFLNILFAIAFVVGALFFFGPWIYGIMIEVFNKLFYIESDNEEVVLGDGDILDAQ